MLQFDVIVAAILGGASYAAAQTLARKCFQKIPRYSARGSESFVRDLSGLRASLTLDANNGLTNELARIADIRKRLDATMGADRSRLAVSLRSLVDDTAAVIRLSHEKIMAVSDRRVIEPSRRSSDDELDPAGVAAQPWFPAGAGSEPARPDELRSTPRFPYPHVQSIAYSVNGDSEAANFFDVQFRDISTNGFSFYIPQRIECDQLIARLGVDPDTVLVLAKIMYQSEVRSDHDSVFRVGCQILQPVEQGRRQ